MNVLTAKNAYIQSTRKIDLPKTARGRALYTVDWFLNGKPVLRNHDKSHIQIDGGFAC
jgi:hypothetical protein